MRIPSEAVLIKRVLESNFRRPGEPYKVTLAVTSKCNSRCRTCNIWRTETGNELSSEEINRIFRATRIPWFNLTGGEPFLRDDLPEIFRVLDDGPGPCLVNITTNGLLTDKILSASERILDTGTRRVFIVVSIDGPERVNDRIRGVKGAWKRSVETLRGLRELSSSGRLRVFCGYTISNINIGFLQKTLDELSGEVPGFGADDFHFNLFHTSGHFYRNAESRAPDRESAIRELSWFERGLSRRFSVTGLLESRYRILLKQYLEGKHLEQICSSMDSSCYISSEGDVYPCIHYNRKAGSLRESGYDFPLIWNSERAQMIRDAIKTGICPGCWTPCEAYQTILSNLLRRKRAIPKPCSMRD